MILKCWSESGGLLKIKMKLALGRFSLEGSPYELLKPQLVIFCK